MTNSGYRKAIFKAFSFPVGLFLCLPLAVMVLASYPDIQNAAASFVWAATLVVPIYAVGFLLAPWSGRQLPWSKGPAFFVAVLAACAPAFVIFAQIAYGGSLQLALSGALFFMLFAIPASLLGALFFIGICQQQASEALANDS
jgi:hypothetical protein